jgi:hypothetical protein
VLIIGAVVYFVSPIDIIPDTGDSIVTIYGQEKDHSTGGACSSEFSPSPKRYRRNKKRKYFIRPSVNRWIRIVEEV